MFVLTNKQGTTILYDRYYRLGETEMRSDSIWQDVKIEIIFKWQFLNELYYDQTQEETIGGSTANKSNSSYLIDFTLQL